MISVRLALYGAGLALAIGLLWWAHHTIYRSGYDDATAEMAKQVAQANETARLAEINSREAVEAVDASYQVQLQDLDTRYRDAASRIGPVRVSKCPSGIALSRDPKPATVDHGPAKADELSREIGGDLEQLVRDADEQTQRLIACQAYAAEVSR